MPLDAKRKEKLKERTREHAGALIEDLEHIHHTLSKKEPTRSDLRALSVILRRLFIDDDLRNIAAPRIGRVHLHIPDNKPFYKAHNRGATISLFASGGASIFGIGIRAVLYTTETRHIFKDFNPERTIKVRLDNFLNQQILCIDNYWITRKHAIKYIANVASGIHSGTPETAPQKDKDVFRQIERLRKRFSYVRENKKTIFDLNTEASSKPPNPLAYNKNALDIVLAEMLCAAHYLVTSPDIKKLEAQIKKELATS